MSGPRSRKERVAAVVAATLGATVDVRNDWRWWRPIGQLRIGYTVTALVPERGSNWTGNNIGKYGVRVLEAGVQVSFRAFATRRAAKARAIELWRQAKAKFDSTVNRKQAAALRKLEAPKQRAAKRRVAASDPQRRLQHAQQMLRHADTRLKRAATLQKRWKRAVVAAQKAVDKTARLAGGAE